MHGLNLIDDNDNADGTVFREDIMLALLGFAAIVMLLRPHLNPPVEATEPTQPPGNVIVELHWPDDIDADIDLWVEAPGDVPVGYSNKGGQIFNLLRDDLGHSGDVTGRNYEVAFSRGTPAGAYTINLHLYRNNTGRLPITAIVVVGVKVDPDSTMQLIATERVELVRVGQEITAVRFSLDGSGDLVPGSIHRLQRALRTAQR